MKDSLKILIAEDEFVIRETLKLYVNELGHQVIAEAYDGRTAIKKALEYDPDLIIMDINMPNMDGIKAIGEINKRKIIPSIIVSAYHEQKLIERANKKGVVNYLLKPIDMNDLKVAIDISMNNFLKLENIKLELTDTKQALEDRKYIERAKGILMDHLNISEAESMKRLQKMSRDKNKKLVVIAKKVINAGSLFDKKL